jgi:flagellar biosynthesis/type III secretory pathway protein FliH
MATVIKASTRLQASDATAYRFDDLGDRAVECLDDVRRRAVEILSGAEQEAIAIRHRAEEQGRAAALQAAEQVLEEHVDRQLATLLPALGKAIDGIRSAQAEWLLHWEKTAVRVATAIAGRVIRREVERAPEITLALVREALELAAGSGDIELRMHPDDVAALGTQVERLAGELARLGKPEIVADPKIEKGGCRIETRFGAIDQQFTAQLARIEQELA